MQGEMAAAAGNAFRQLNDADLRFGELADHEGRTVELSHATFHQFLICPDRDIRRKAFDQYYEQFSNHENTLAATLTGSIQRDVYYAKARNYDSSLQAALFPDNVPVAVYDNLITRRANVATERASLLGRATSQDGSDRHSSLRHLRADSERHQKAPHLGQSDRGRDRITRTRWDRNTPASWKKDCAVAGPIVIPIAASKVARSVAVSFDGDPLHLDELQTRSPE